MKDSPVSAEIMNEIRECVKEGLELIGLSQGASPDEVQRAIFQKVNDLRDDISATPEDFDGETILDLALRLGCLWGQVICDELDWEWANVTFPEGDFFAILTPDRSRVMLPLHYFKELMNDPEKDPTSELIYNMLKAGNLPPAEANEYLVFG